MPHLGVAPGRVNLQDLANIIVDPLLQYHCLLGSAFVEQYVTCKFLSAFLLIRVIRVIRQSGFYTCPGIAEVFVYIILIQVNSMSQHEPSILFPVRGAPLPISSRAR